MAQTLQNQITYAKSMNGIITLSDGAGTTISNGIIDTDLLEVEQLNATNFTTNAMIANSLQILRTSTTAVNNLLGTVIDVGPILNNVKFDTVNRQIQIWDDTATSQLMTIDVDNNFIATQGSLSAQALTTNTLTTQSLLTAYSFLQQVESVTSTNYTWAFGNKNIIFLNSSSIPTFQLPTPSASQIGTVVYVSVEANFGFIVKAVVAGHSIQNEVNTATNTLTYDNTIKYFAFMAIGTAFITWRMVNYQAITKNYADANYGKLALGNTWTSTNAFNTNIPTTTLTPNADNQFITRIYADGRYGELATANAWSSTNTFNTAIPTTTLTPNADNQLITRIYADGRYGELATANTWTGVNTFSNASLVKTDANNNMYVGLNAGSSLALGGIINAFFGVNSGLNCRGSYNVALGYGTLSSTQGTSIGNGYLQGNCCFGYNAGAYFSGTSSQTVYNNTCVGLWSGQYHQLGDNNTFIGYAAGSDGLGNWNDSIAIGTFAHIFGNNQIVLGRDTEMTYPMGGLTIPSQQQLILQDKTKIQCCQFTGTPTTFTINWTTNEYVVVNSATCNQINLPQAINATTKYVGACFHICRTHLSTSNLVISAFGTEKINWKGTLHSFVPIDSWVMSISFICVDNVAGNGVWSVFTYNYRAELATDANKIQTLADSTNTNYPVCFTTIATTGYNNVYANSSLNYNPSTSLLTVPNLTVSGTLNATINPVFPAITVNNIYKPNSTAFIGSNDTVLPGLPTLYGFYFWTDANPSGVPDTVITLPQLTTDMDGCKLTFRRIAYQGTPFVPRQLVIKTPTALFGGLNQLIVARDSATTILAGTNYVLLTTAVSRLGAFASLVVRQNAWYVID